MGNGNVTYIMQEFNFLWVFHDELLHLLSSCKVWIIGINPGAQNLPIGWRRPKRERFGNCWECSHRPRHSTYHEWVLIQGVNYILCLLLIFHHHQCTFWWYIWEGNPLCVSGDELNLYHIPIRLNAFFQSFFLDLRRDTVPIKRSLHLIFKNFVSLLLLCFLQRWIRRHSGDFFPANKE